jgi:hypothetical protein
MRLRINHHKDPRGLGSRCATSSSPIFPQYTRTSAHRTLFSHWSFLSGRTRRSLLLLVLLKRCLQLSLFSYWSSSVVRWQRSLFFLILIKCPLTASLFLLVLLKCPLTALSSLTVPHQEFAYSSQTSYLSSSTVCLLRFLLLLILVKRLLTALLYLLLLFLLISAFSPLFS